MSIERADLTALKVMLENNATLREKLKSSENLKMTVTLLDENATLNNIPFDSEAYEMLLKNLANPDRSLALADAQLEHVAAGFSNPAEMLDPGGYSALVKLITLALEPVITPKDFSDDPNSPYQPRAGS
jgi:hypothetical protein